MEIKSNAKSTSVNITATVLGIDVNITYWYTNAVPEIINVNARYDGNGVGSNIFRSYRADGEFSPVNTIEIYPFTDAFDAELKEGIITLFANYDS